MPLNPFSGVLGYKRAAHLLRRASFGTSKQLIDSFVDMSAAEAVALLFPATLPEPVLPIDPATGAEWITNPLTDSNSDENALQDYFKGWLLGQIMGIGIDEGQQLGYSVREKIAFFMHTHFTTMQSKVNNSKYLYHQNALFRQFAFDKNTDETFNFSELTKKLCVDNAMLVFLDGKLNVKGSPNENFARELFELFVIGKGLAGSIPPDLGQGDYLNYTEQDIQAAAEVLSGWDVDKDLTNIDEQTLLPRGKVKGGTIASSHDNDIKQFSARLGNMVIQPDPTLLDLSGKPTEESALDEISQLIDLLYSKEETARYICRKIYRFYVYYNIPQELDDTIIKGMADTFKANNFKIQPVLEELFKSQHFYEAAGGNGDDNFGCIIKSPLDLLTGTIKFFNVSIPDYVSETSLFYETTKDLIKKMKGQGLDFYEPVEVAGYPAFHQYPAFNRNWISTNYLTRRYEFIRTSMSMMNMDNPEAIHIDVLTFVKSNFPNDIASDAKTLIITLAKYLLPLSDNLTFDTNADDSADITTERLNYFLHAFLFNPQLDVDPEATWTIRYTNNLDSEVIQRQLENLLNAMLQSPEYQLK